jgi:spoIIIJ-associated protein
MTYDFEGKTEKEAIEKAMLELGLERDSFDVEILEVQRGGLFKKSSVRIRLHTDEPVKGAPRKAERGGTRGGEENPVSEVPPDAELEEKLIAFVSTVLEKMDTAGTVSVLRREKRKLTLDISTPDSAIVIGKKGRTLDALQLIATLYARQVKKSELRVVLDCEKYRLHHEEALIRLAKSAASRVRSSRHSMLLEPMNPYDRRLIHTTLDRNDDIETRSEGDGLYKQVRILYKTRG